jgi:DNA-binding IclR family transcriptional regulator
LKAKPAPAETVVEPISPPERRVRQVPAVERAVAILRLLGRSDQPMGVNQVARTLKLIPSTCLHILRILVDEELVAFDPVTKHYRLDVGILPLARGVMRRNRFNELIQPSLDQVAERFGVTAVGVQVTAARHMVVVAISRAEQPFRLQVDIGSRFPALLSATGRCFAAFGGQSWDELEKQFKTLRWENPPSFDAWRAEVQRVRELGYSMDEGAYIRGVTVVSMPVFSAREAMSHAIVAVGVEAQLKDDMLKSMIDDMHQAAEFASGQLGGDTEQVPTNRQAKPRLPGLHQGNEA